MIRSGYLADMLHVELLPVIALFFSLDHQELPKDDCGYRDALPSMSATQKSEEHNKAHDEGGDAADDPIRPWLREVLGHENRETDRGCDVHHCRLDDEIDDHNGRAGEERRVVKAGLVYESARDDQNCGAQQTGQRLSDPDGMRAREMINSGVPAQRPIVALLNAR